MGVRALTFGYWIPWGVIVGRALKHKGAMFSRMQYASVRGGSQTEGQNLTPCINMREAEGEHAIKERRYKGFHE